MEQRIRELCSELLTTQHTIAAQSTGEELRSAIHEYLEALRHDAEIRRS